MSHLFRGILGGVAVALTFGAAQLALGRDLPGLSQNGTVIPATVVNRTAKTDKAPAITAPAAQTRTISLRLDGLSDTSFLVRVPVADAARNSSGTPALLRSGARKIAVACEPVVSVLTEIAKRLEPGRCVT